MKDVVESNDKGEKFDFTEYKHAKQVVEDYPGMIYLLSKIIPALEEKKHYTPIWMLLQSTYDSKMCMEIQYDYYKNVLETKGKIHDRTK